MSLLIMLIYVIIILILIYTYSQKPKNLFDILKLVKLTYVRDYNDTTDDTWRIPGPLSLPLFGTKWIYFWKYKISKLHEVYAEMQKTFGDVVLEVTSDKVPILNLFNRQDIEKVLRFPSKYPFRPPTEIVAFYRKSRPDRYASIGLINAQGEDWHYLRSKLTPNIQSRKTLQAFLPSLNEICDDFIELIRKKRDQNNVVENFQDITNLIGLESACCLILGRRMGYLEPEDSNNSFKELATAVKNLYKLQRDAYFGSSMWKYMPTKTYRDFVENEEIVYRIISEIVDKTLSENKLECQDNDVRHVFLSILNTEGLDIREKKSGIIDFITAGIELLSHTLSFVLYYLSLHPSAQEQIYNEISEFGSVLTHDDLNKAVYTKACIQETFRICPTAFCIARILEEDFILSGYKVPAGTVVLCQTMLACRNKESFSNPDDYIPERWLGPNLEIGSNIVQPFGSGKRSCPGKKYSEMELAMVVIKLIKEFKIDYVSEFGQQFEFLLAPKTPVNIKFCDRY